MKRIVRPGLVLLPMVFLLFACAPSSPRSGLAVPVVPAAADHSTPSAAVRTYVGWVSYAYRMANSDVASDVASPYEGVRVDSYIELNRQKGQGIEQRLVSLEERGESKDGTRALLATREEWSYRYFSLATKRYSSGAYTASYDATYTLVARPSGGWWVDKVDATPLTPVK